MFPFKIPSHESMKNFRTSRTWLIPSWKSRKASAKNLKVSEHSLASGFKYFFIFTPILGKILILTIIFQRDWNHQLVHHVPFISTYFDHLIVISCFVLLQRLPQSPKSDYVPTVGISQLSKKTAASSGGSAFLEAQYIPLQGTITYPPKMAFWRWWFSELPKVGYVNFFWRVLYFCTGILQSHLSDLLWWYHPYLDSHWLSQTTSCVACSGRLYTKISWVQSTLKQY